MTARPSDARRPAHPGRRLWLAAALACVGVFVLTSLQVSGGWRLAAGFDEAVRTWVRALRTPARTVVAMDLTALGSTAVVTLIATVCCVVFALLRDARALAHLAVASIGAGLWSQALKRFFERARPDDLPPLVQALGYSYPSGHTVTATALYLTFAVLMCRVLRRPHERAVIFAVAALVVAIVGATRIYLGVHHPSDVLGGAAVGAAWAFVLAGLIGYPRARGEMIGVERRKD